MSQSSSVSSQIPQAAKEWVMEINGLEEMLEMNANTEEDVDMFQKGAASDKTKPDCVFRKLEEIFTHSKEPQAFKTHVLNGILLLSDICFP
jgi:hypothetical protein